MSWEQSFLAILMYCMSGANQPHSLEMQNQCRNEKLKCLKIATFAEPELKTPQEQVQREIYLLNGCLDNSNFKAMAVDASRIKLITPPNLIQPKKN